MPPSKNRTIDGQLMRLCSGPSHDEPTWLPATEKYFYKRKSGHMAGYLDHKCRLCRVWKPGIPLDEGGWVAIEHVGPFFLEGVRRVGLSEFARRVGITRVNMRYIINGKRRFVYKRTAKRAMLELVSMRRKGEVRHRHSIRHGSAVRGREEKVPSKRQDFYHPTGDDDLEARRRSTANMSPEKRKEVARKDAIRPHRRRKGARSRKATS